MIPPTNAYCPRTRKKSSSFTFFFLHFLDETQEAWRNLTSHIGIHIGIHSGRWATGNEMKCGPPAMKWPLTYLSIRPRGCNSCAISKTGASLPPVLSSSGLTPPTELKILAPVFVYVNWSRFALIPKNGYSDYNGANPRKPYVEVDKGYLIIPGLELKWIL